MASNSRSSTEGSTTGSQHANPGLLSPPSLQLRPSAPTRAFSVPDIHFQPPFLKYIQEPQRFKSFSHSVHSARTYRPRPYFRSRRIKKGTIDRPELREHDPRQKWVTIIPMFGFLLGLMTIAILAWDGWASVPTHVYCPVFVDDFSGGFNSTIWSKEIQTGGYKYV